MAIAAQFVGYLWETVSVFLRQVNPISKGFENTIHKYLKIYQYINALQKSQQHGPIIHN